MRFDTVLGVLDIESADDIARTELTVDAAHIESLLTKRQSARADRDFAKADAIRDELDCLGVEIKDSPDGTTWAVRPRT
jgi:cysteinyl-tRNA synthetase